jgi:hypothetical protein
VYNGGFPTGEGEKIGRLLKKTSFAECWLQWLSAKRENGALSGCPLCRVLLSRHSAKKATRVAVDSILCREPDGDTRQRLRPRWCAVTATFLCRGPLLALGKFFAESPRKSSRQRLLCRSRLPREPFAEWGSRQTLCRVPLGLCRVPEALGKSAVSGSANTRQRPHAAVFLYCLHILTNRERTRIYRHRQH